MPWNGAAPPARDRGREVFRGSDRRGVLVLVGPNAVAVLEVDAQILDRLGVQLAADAVVDLGGDCGRKVERFSQFRRGSAMGGQRLPRLLGPAAHGRRVVAVGGHVNRVHGLTAAAVAAIRGGEGGVRIGETRVEFIGECVAVVGHLTSPRWARCFRMVEIISG